MLKDKVVFITGSAGGIGLGIAHAVLDANGRVALSDLDDQMLEKARDELLSKTGVTKEHVFTVNIDVTKEESVKQALIATKNQFGTLDGLVNNAGVISLGANIEASAEDWRKQMEVNVIGTHNCCKIFAEQLIEINQKGAIVNIASNAGKVGYPNMAGYNATKAAVINLTRTLSSEWSEYNINVNAICPGGVLTPMLKDVAKVVGKRIGENPDELLKTMVPAQLGRHIETIEIGRVVAFLLSDNATIIRGQAINADGGDTPY